MFIAITFTWSVAIACNTERISTGWFKPVKHYVGNPDKSLGLLAGKLVDANLWVVAVHLYMSPMPVVLCTEVFKDV